MGYITKDEYEKRLKQIQAKNLHKLRKRKLHQERRKYNIRLKLPSTSKLVLMGVFLICIEILVFAEYAMISLGDTSAMYALIGVPAALIPICLGYYNKAKAENTIGGITYEQAFAQKHQANEDGTVG